ncbi:DUF4132 domain-containing protein [Glycomyces terrestris]|uniref:DUF4132 domain-containing protein n=1 Tax=Glycomyces terrestris TaxID=2493553 RepID=A0A426UT26_9ACTN|nr:DUF4132 domain-containing protein [Glycomyces terrestris]RRR96880.1 DUF4132 domain-containing protein [Glycomyces terrestris]
MNESQTPLPDESRLAFPDSWHRFVRPRRGSGKPKRMRLDPEAGRKLLAEFDAAVRERLDHEANTEYREAGLAYLAGSPDLRGAAAVAALARTTASAEPYVQRPLFDLAAAEHGLPFAAAALAEFLLLDITSPDRGSAISLIPTSFQNHRWARANGAAALDAVRAHLAALPDDEYAAVLDALAALRTDPMRRFAVSLLVPDETDWLDQVCAEFQAQRPRMELANLLLGVITTPGQLEGVDHSGAYLYWFRTAGLADLVHRLGVHAVPVVESMFTTWLDGDDRKTLCRTLAMIPSDAAFDRLLDHLDRDPGAIGHAMEAAARFPQRALRAVAARLSGAEPAARKRLLTVLFSDPLLLGAALERQSEEVRETIAAATGLADRVPAAPAEAVPALLASPPWKRARPEAAPVVLKGLMPLPISRVVWAEGEREAWAEASVSGERDWTEDAERIAELAPHHQVRVLACAPPELTAHFLPEWQPQPGYISPEVLQRLLAAHGDAAAEQVATAAGWDASMRGVLAPIANLTAARLVADALVRLKTMRPMAFAWLDRHAADAAALLVPDALGKAKKPRAAAEAALRYIAAHRGPDTVRDAAGRYGPDAAAAIEPLVDVDPFLPAGVTIPEPGPWVSAFALPQLLLPGGERALPDSVVRDAATVLALGTPDYEYAGVAVLAETCDRASLTRFSWALFEQWLTAGAPWDQSWALTQLMHFGDDRTVRELQALVARWPGENQHHRAVKGLQVLGAIGTETALRAIQHIGEKAKFSAIKEEAREQITAIAQNLGLSAEQLADRLVPDFGLRDEAALVLDYGPRQFKVGFDEQLKPFVTDADGKPRKSLPKPAAKDDADLAEAAYQRFAALRKDLRTVAADQVKRLERAMVTGRAWTPAEFREHLVEHPLVWHLARRLVWTADDGAGPVAFRLAEDRTCTGVEEDEFALADTALVRVAHPVVLGDETAAWAEVFADYEIVQPFPQLGRETDAFTDEEVATGHLTRFEGASVPVGALLGLVKKGWTRAPALDAGIENGMWCALPGTGYLVLDLDPGITVGDVNDHWIQNLKQVVLSRSDMGGWTRAQATPGLTIGDPVAASEALTALARAVAAGADR